MCRLVPTEISIVPTVISNLPGLTAGSAPMHSTSEAMRLQGAPIYRSKTFPVAGRLRPESFVPDRVPPGGRVGKGRRGTPAGKWLPEVYEDFRNLAARYLRRERRDHGLQATALVHEAWMRIADQRRARWKGRTHFFAVGAEAMRRVLIDWARSEGREKRGGGRRRVTLGAAEVEEFQGEPGSVDLRDCLDELSKLDPRQARVVELRFFAGLTVEEVAQVIGVSKRTVEGDWTLAKAWLRRAIAQGGAA